MRTSVALLPLFALAAGPAAAAELPSISMRPLPGHGGDTECSACHTADGWRPVTFNHDRTGFVLEGRHREVSCKACHRTNTFADPIPRACSACHRDVHLGRLGQRCQDCHDPTSFAAPAFGPEAHRRTNFPLTGRHAVLACEECHGDRRDRGFDRPTARCEGCHQADLALASGGGAAVNHALAGFTTACRSCHSTWRFTPASFPAHQACFDILHGPHAGIRCMDCHTTLPPVSFTQPLSCSTDTANCIRCHANAPSQHQGVAGFAMVNRKCYECHRFATGQ
ncbi:MAG TPA: cytochrome c3 family protein [Anaeromyxobacter sp.]|nr:cytochrome c3 family protein [Anaeromyxobacter sp.]